MATSKKRRSRNALLTFTVSTLFLSVILCCGATLFLKAYRNHLTAQKQELETQIIAMEMQNDEAQKEVDELASSQRVTAMAQNTLTYQNSNIESIPQK